MAEANLVVDVLEEIRRELAGKTLLWPEDSDRAARRALDQLKDAPAEIAIEFVISGLQVIREDRTWAGRAVHQTVGMVLRRKLDFTEDQVLQMIELVSVEHREFPFRGVLHAAASVAMSPRLAVALARLRTCITDYLGGPEARNLHSAIDNLLNGPAPQTALTVEGAWSQAVFQEVAGSLQQKAWEQIFLHTAGLKSGEAPKKWRIAAQELVEQVGRPVFLSAAARWLELGPSPGRPGVQLSTGEAELQTGFIWFLADHSEERLASLVARFGEAALKKIPMLGAVSQKVGNACVNVLAEMPGSGPVSQLSRLKQRVKYDTAQRLIEKALARAAARVGVSREEIEEMTVPDCGLGPDGTRNERFGEYSVRVSVKDTTSAAVQWSDAQGNASKGPPACVKRDHAEAWKALQQSTAEMEKMLTAHRTRMEGLLLSRRAFSIETLRTHYLNHPLLAGMARRLIWQFDSGPGIWHEGRVVDSAERPIDVAAQKSACLWHPVSSDPQTILHWRCWLEDRGIRQPFKQAHREVYLITDAERQTGGFSNRFAGHVLRQHPFAALCESRGWTFRLMGQWDSHNTPVKLLPQFGLRIEFAVDFPRDESEVSGHYIYLLLRTGAVRFVDDARVPCRLESIPPVVFSEVMRDLDLFAGVASIGSDPSWGLKEPVPFREYWSAFSFGELTEMALNRKTVLERLLPRLSIRDRCRIDGHFLVVRGDRTTYRIHLGSGNVLMEPGSRYLCIVQGGATKASPASLPLPFEGDQTLSLILSKAFLLADDRKIKDPSILRQF